MEKKTKRNQVIVLLRINQFTMNQKDSGKNLRSTGVKNTVTYDRTTNGNRNVVRSQGGWFLTFPTWINLPLFRTFPDYNHLWN